MSLPRSVAAMAGTVAMLTVALAAQQLPDRDYRPVVDQPAYAEGKGPTVCVDEAHANFHTLGERFWAFGELVRRDGFVVRANTAALTAASLGACRILGSGEHSTVGDLNGKISLIGVVGPPLTVFSEAKGKGRSQSFERGIG